MSSSNYITSIPIFNGAQGKFYMINGIKYHICFPVQWAMNHLVFQVGDYAHQSGPIECRNCESYGCIRGVFVGYCSNCLNEYLSHSKRRGFNLFPGVIISHLDNERIWQQYPYMYGVDKSEIGDSEDTNSEYDVYEYMQNDVEYISSSSGTEDKESDSDTVVPGYIEEQ